MPARLKARAERRLAHYWVQCDHVLVSQPDDVQRVAQVLPTSRISYLRRGLAREQFHPDQRDRQQLEAKFDIAPGSFIVLFVGRLASTKNVMLLVEAMRLLVAQGRPVHAIFVGQGNLRTSIQAKLGQAVTLTGQQDQATLAHIYASCDLFAFPSHTEIYSNVVHEARACGLPVVVSAHAGTARPHGCAMRR